VTPCGRAAWPGKRKSPDVARIDNAVHQVQYKIKSKRIPVTQQIHLSQNPHRLIGKISVDELQLHSLVVSATANQWRPLQHLTETVLWEYDQYLQRNPTVNT
jgi:hypothetical protein